MTIGLRRWQVDGDDHFITFSCHGRRPYLVDDRAKQTFLTTLSGLRDQHDWKTYGYVLMPEHVHMLTSEPKNAILAAVLRVLKVQTSKRLKGDLKAFWEKRYHDFNVFSSSWDKRMEKVKYMHRNPVARGLVARPEEYMWSSFRHYLLGDPSPVLLDTSWVEGWQRQEAHASR